VTFDTTASWPVWSPDSRRIAYTRFSQASGSALPDGRLTMVPADGSGAPQTVMSQPGTWRATSFERGGRGLVYSGARLSQTREEIWRVSLDSGATPQQVLASSFDNGSPSLSPDGRWLAYVANESGRKEVYVRPYPGAAQVKPLRRGRRGAVDRGKLRRTLPPFTRDSHHEDIA
jgi:Tol biopolymer transport system component